jgi:hypothetical protein
VTQEGEQPDYVPDTSWMDLSWTVNGIIDESVVAGISNQIIPFLSRIQAVINPKLEATQRNVPDMTISQLASFSDKSLDDILDDFLQSDQMAKILSGDLNNMNQAEKDYIPEYSDELLALLKIVRQELLQNNPGREVDYIDELKILFKNNKLSDVKDYYRKVIKNKKLEHFALTASGYDPSGKNIDMNRSYIIDELYKSFIAQNNEEFKPVIAFVNKCVRYVQPLEPVRRWINELTSADLKSPNDEIRESALAYKQSAQQPEKVKYALQQFGILLKTLNVPEDDPIYNVLKKPEGLVMKSVKHPLRITPAPPATTPAPSTSKKSFWPWKR